jgi:hypothetical protein
VAERTFLAAGARVVPDPDLERLIDGLADARVARSIRRGAINAAAQVTARGARVTAGARVRTGQLRESIRVRTKVRGDDVEGFVFAGSRTTVYRAGRATKQSYKNANGSYNVAFYAAFVERGTRPHFIPKTRVFGRGVAFGGVVRQQVYHPGARPVRYMERALANTQPQIGGAMDQYMGRRLRRVARQGK